MSRLARKIKAVLPRSLLGRSLLILITPLVLLQLVTTIIFYERHWDTVTRRLSRALAGEISLVIDQLAAYPGTENQAWIFAAAKQNLNLDIAYRPGAILENRVPEAVYSILERELTNALDAQLRRPYTFALEGPTRQIRVGIQLKDGVLEVIAPRKRLFSSSTYIFVMWMVGAALVLYGIAIIFMRNQVRPIRRLAQAAERFGRGLDVPDFKPEGAMEVRQAAKSFIGMRERIHRHVHQRTALLAGVSHDLRTPLTRMKLELAMGTKDAVGTALAQDVREMERMIDGYLAFARGEGTETARPVSLNALLKEAVSDARRGGQAVDLHVEEEAVIDLKPESLRRGIDNIIANAGRYAHHLSVRAGRRDGAYEILFDDDGPGIPADRREDVFKPFFRLEDSRNQATGGVGLGMTIARDAARSHGGDVVLDESPKGGLRVRLKLPF